MSSLPFRLLAITPPTGRVDAGAVEQWWTAGAATVGIAVLLRTPDAPAGAVIADPRFAGLREACRAREIPVLLGTSQLGPAGPSLREHGLAGVQLRGDPTPAQLEAARVRLGGLLLGRSVHGPPRAGAADYTVLAPVHTPGPHGGRAGKKPVGVASLRAWVQAVPEPVFALGGVAPGTAAACVSAGARGLAGISTFFGPDEAVAENVRALLRALRHAPTS